jgi:hypothetical protein
VLTIYSTDNEVRKEALRLADLRPGPTPDVMTVPLARDRLSDPFTRPAKAIVQLSVPGFPVSRNYEIRKELEHLTKPRTGAL